jgi:hypothetical protein
MLWREYPWPAPCFRGMKRCFLACATLDLLARPDHRHQSLLCRPDHPLHRKVLVENGSAEKEQRVNGLMVCRGGALGRDRHLGQEGVDVIRC